MIEYKKLGDRGTTKPPTLTGITQLNYSFEVIVSLMKYSLYCNEGCIDLNSSTLLGAPASTSVGAGGIENLQYSAKKRFLFYHHRTLGLITNQALLCGKCLLEITLS